jgi:drug/metabolite transporter, DME family
VTRPAGHATGHPAGSAGVGALGVLLASLLWGTTGTAATFAPAVGPLAIGSVAMGVGGLLQALVASRRLPRGGAPLRGQKGPGVVGGGWVGGVPRGV